MGSPKIQKTPPETAKALTARLTAVQAIYQIIQNDVKPAKIVLQQYLDDAKTGVEVDGEELVRPDGVLLSKIVNGVDERWEDLTDILEANFKQGAAGYKKVEALLAAILMSASYELLAHHDIDVPIIINDYLNVTHGFYDQGEVKLVNGVLDNVAKAVRD